MEGNTVNFAKIIGHYHIGSNMPGYLPEGDVYCADILEVAGDMLAEELGRTQSLMEDMCEAVDMAQREKGSDCCGWCAEYWSIETVLSGIRSVEKDVLHAFVRDNGYTYHHTPPSGAPIVFWITDVTGGVGPRYKCDIFKEQCADEGIAIGDDGCEVEIIDADAGDGTEVEVY